MASAHTRIIQKDPSRGNYGRDVSNDNPLFVQPMANISGEVQEVSSDHPFPVSIDNMTLTTANPLYTYPMAEISGIMRAISSDYPMPATIEGVEIKLDSENALPTIMTDPTSDKQMKVIEGSSAAVGDIASVVSDPTVKQAIEGFTGIGGDIVYANVADDFTAAFQDSDEIRLTNMPFVPEATNVVVGDIKRIDTNNLVTTLPLTDVEVQDNGDNTYDIVLGGLATALVTTDSYVVILVGPTKNRDIDLDSGKSLTQNPEWAHRTDAELLVTAYDITAAFTDMGAEIDVSDYTTLGIFVNYDRGDTTTAQIRALHKHESGGSSEYREIYLSSPASNKTDINLNVYEIPTDVDQLFKFDIDVTTTPYIQLQGSSDADGSGTFTVYITKS